MRTKVCESMHLIGSECAPNVLFMQNLLVVKWKRFGQDRVYVNTQDGERVGWYDLNSNEVVLENKSLKVDFENALASFIGSPVSHLLDIPCETHNTDAIGVHSQGAFLSDCAGVDSDPMLYLWTLQYQSLKNRGLIWRIIKVANTCMIRLDDCNMRRRFGPP